MRSAQFFALGAFWIAPLVNLHYTYLLTYLFPRVTPTTAVYKMLFDQFVFAPVFVASFFPVLNVLSGKSWEDTKSDMRVKYWETLKANWKLWIPAQVVNFYFVPVPY